MPLVKTADLVTPGRGIVAFNVITLEHAEAIVAGAEEAGTPVICQISENAVAFHHGRLKPIAAATAAIAEASSVPVGLHLDHVTDLEPAAPGGRPRFRLGHVRRFPARLRGECRPYRARPPAGPTRMASGSRPNWARSGARTGLTPRASAPTRTRPGPSWPPPAWTPWPSRWAAPTP